jgi:Arabinose-binding domain of AraC transcription regulator, N-term
MVRWDVERAPTSVQLLVGLGADYGLTAQTCLKRTGLRVENLGDPAAAVGARQELTVIANLLAALGDPPGIGLEAGIRYHLTTYGIWGFAMISSPSWRRCDRHRPAVPRPHLRLHPDRGSRPGRGVPPRP